MDSLLFFYSNWKDLCSAQGFTLNATENTSKGNLCLVNTNARVAVYACPAGESACWTEEAQAGQNLQRCGDGKWHCNPWDQCLEDTGRENNRCGPQSDGRVLPNPLASVKADEASQIAQNALRSSVTGLLGTTVPTALAATISTTTATTDAAINVVPSADSVRLGSSLVSALATRDSSSAATATPASASASASQGTSDWDSDDGSTSTLSAASATATAALHTEPEMSSSTLSNGAIAGIAVGGAAVLILFAIVAFLIYRRRKRRSRALAAARDQSIEDDEPETKLEASTFRDTHNDSHHDMPQTMYHNTRHEDIPPPPRSAGADSVGARSVGAASAISAVSALSVLSPTSPVDAPPSPMTTVKQGPSHLVEEQAAPERPVSPLLAEAQHPSEGEALISALEPSPLQSLMMHGKYPPDRE